MARADNDRASGLAIWLERDCVVGKMRRGMWSRSRGDPLLLRHCLVLNHVLLARRCGAVLRLLLHGLVLNDLLAHALLLRRHLALRMLLHTWLLLLLLLQMVVMMGCVMMVALDDLVGTVVLWRDALLGVDDIALRVLSDHVSWGHGSSHCDSCAALSADDLSWCDAVIDIDSIT